MGYGEWIIGCCVFKTIQNLINRFPFSLFRVKIQSINKRHQHSKTQHTAEDDKYQQFYYLFFLEFLFQIYFKTSFYSNFELRMKFTCKHKSKYNKREKFFFFNNFMFNQSSFINQQNETNEIFILKCHRFKTRTYKIA